MTINIPTELLRTLVAVVDQRSYTRAANLLGVTQPAVSAQIKRLQGLLGTDIFVRDVPGVMLTTAGDEVVAFARRILSLNDQLLKVTTPPAPARTVRIGVTGDYFSPYLPRAFAKFRDYSARPKFHVVSGVNDQLLQDLRAGSLDIIVLLSADKPERDARFHWMEEMIWGRGADMRDPDDGPVPLVTRGEFWTNYRIAVSALEKTGRRYEVTLVAPTFLTLLGAVRHGIGIMPFARRRLMNTDLVACREDALPRLQELVCSIYVSESANTKFIDSLAEEIAACVQGPQVRSNPAVAEPGLFRALCGDGP